MQWLNRTLEEVWPFYDRGMSKMIKVRAGAPKGPAALCVGISARCVYEHCVCLSCYPETSGRELVMAEGRWGGGRGAHRGARAQHTFRCLEPVQQRRDIHRVALALCSACVLWRSACFWCSVCALAALALCVH